MSRLPRWAVDNRTAVAREAEPYRGWTPEQHARAVASACRAAARQLASRPDREPVLQHRDPLPASSLATLRRLQSHYRQRT